MSKFVVLQMFLEQSKKNLGHQSSATMAVPFLQWKVGYIVKNSSEEFTIKEINSGDGKMHHENTTVTLVNIAGETRTLVGRSMARYEFVSFGDIAPPKAEARSDVHPMSVNIDGIREFYPRKSGEGTRILMMDKTAYIVADDFGAVMSKLREAGATVAGQLSE